MSQPPPPRYRIVEQGRRLIVTDTWARDKSPPAPVIPSQNGRDLMAPKAGSTANRIVRAGDEGGSFLRRLALIACAGAEDAEGRPILSTASWFDKKAPRQFSLDQSGVQKVGGTVLAMLALIGFVLLLTAVVGFEILFIAIVPLVLVGKNAGSLATGWVDWVGKSSAV